MDILLIKNPILVQIYEKQKEPSLCFLRTTLFPTENLSGVWR